MLTNVFGSVLLISIMSSSLICVICLVKLIFRDRLSARWHYYIWFLLLIRLLVPFTPDYTLSANSIYHEKKQNANNVKEFEIKNSPELNNSHEIQDFGPEAVDVGVDRLEYNYPYEAEDSGKETTTGFLFNTAGIVWIVGAMLLFIYSLLVNVIIRYKIKKTAVVIKQGGLGALIEDCRRLMNIKSQIPVIYQKHISAPALYGIFRPVLLIPSDIINRLDERELKYIILHELCHYKRKDNILGAVQMMLNIIHWFNPLLWYAFYKMKEDRELVCDEQAISYIKSNERRNYARTLVKILEIFSERSLIHSGASIIQGRSSNMEWRLKFIKALKKKSTVLAISITALVVLLGAFSISYIDGNIKFPHSTYASNDGKDKSGSKGRGGITDRNGLKLVERTPVGSYYPFKSLASHIIGFAGKDNTGLQGIELVMDNEGITKDNITLTIDKNIQEITDSVLERAIEAYKIKNGAAAIVIDPSTGEVLAMCSKPDFDLNDPRSAPKGLSSIDWESMPEEYKIEYLNKSVWRNKALTDTYEPGSTFKAITAAAGLEEEVIRPDSMVNDNAVTISGKNLNCWKPDTHGNETFEQALHNSCNPPFVRVAQDLGVKRFYDYVRMFGFYDKTGFELPGEEKSLFHKEPKEIDMAVASFGQRFQITPLHILSAYGAIANGGKLLRPQIIKEVYDPDGNVVKKFEPQVVRNVISKQTSDVLKDMLEGVVSKGTGKNAYVEGYRIAGKTGTSETTEKNRYIASFVAFAPADNPKIACLVLMDNPTGNIYNGGQVAAPAAGQIIKQVLDYLSKD
ncbi:MAG: penicillin-binding transpeptidase domain-containing protein [Bacillota bacterium]